MELRSKANFENSSHTTSSFVPKQEPRTRGRMCFPVDFRSPLKSWLVGEGRPSNESNSQILRGTKSRATTVANRAAHPPRATPHSTKSPGMFLLTRSEAASKVASRPEAPTSEYGITL